MSLILRFLSCFLFLAVARGGVSFTSGPGQVALIELYTSEGCSSCPPADKWLADLGRTDGLWRDFVPVAFHVNYWDSLGWRDVLATKAHTDRQYAYVAAWGSPSVYTPCFVRNGAEWHPDDSSPRSTSSAAPDAGTLTLAWDPATRTCRVDYRPADLAKISAPAIRDFDASLAFLGCGIAHQIRRGENAGRELRHDFVVLQLETVTLKPTTAGEWSATVTLPARPDVTATRQAVAAWIAKHGKLAPIQAAGGWID